MPETRTCSLCGCAAEAPDGGVPPGWSFGTSERGRGIEHHCETCTRTHIRSIEAKLPEEYW